MIKKITLSLATLFFLCSCATIQPIPHKETVVQPPAQPNGGWSAAYSPDGGMIAFLSSTLHTPADLWIMKADGSGARRITTRGIQEFKWSQDGKSIEFATRRKGFEEVMSIDLINGGVEKRVPGLPSGASIPLYSPDGSLFAFTAPGEQNIRELWIGTSDGRRIEAVTEKINIRSMFWSQDSRKIYYEAGKSYGVGIWEINLTTMESKTLLNKYVGTPIYSAKAGLIAYPYPTNPGEFEVHTMKSDGSDIRTRKAPRLTDRWLAWDTDGQGVYYLGQDIEMVPPDSVQKAPGEKDEKATPHEATRTDIRRVGVTALWRLDLATGEEKRISPASLHVADFSPSPDGKNIVFSGVLEKSFSPEIFSLDTATGNLTQLVKSRVSAWMPVLSPQDASKIAYFTNEGTLNALNVVSNTGDRLTSYPGFVLEGDARLFWLPESDGLAVFSGRGVFAFTENGPVEFPNKGDFRTYLYADISIQEDKVLLSVIPRYGETPGLFQLKAVDNKFVLTDLRFPSDPADWAAELYLHPKWSLDGKKIAFTDGTDVWTMLADGTGRKWITHYAEGKKSGKGREAASSYPSWSVKGDMLCYTLTVYEEKRIVRELWVVKADGTDPKMLFSEEIDSQFQVFQPEYTYPPFFDVDDQRIIFTATDKGVPNIVSVEIKDGKLHRLTDKGAVYPALAPEEGAIYYTSLEGNTEELWIMNSDGTGKHRFAIKAAPLPEKGETEKKITPAPPAESAPSPIKEVDKPAVQTQETEAIKKEEPAKKKAPLKKKKPAKKKAIEAK